jgi:hypothetical protein
LHLITHMGVYTLGRTPLDEGSAHRRGFYLYNKQHSQETNLHAPGGLRTRNPSNLTATDVRLTPLGHRNRLIRTFAWINRANPRTSAGLFGTCRIPTKRTLTYKSAVLLFQSTSGFRARSPVACDAVSLGECLRRLALQ